MVNRSEIAERAAREIHGDCVLCEIFEGVAPDCKPQVDQDAAIVERAIAESQAPHPKLAELRLLTEKAIELARVEIKTRGPVNWADLHVMEAAKVTPDDGREYFIIRIEEAAPDANELQRFIGKYLNENGWSGVEVLTEW